MHDLIQHVPEHDITDSTKLRTFQSCPRKYFYEYVLGWRADTPAHPLVYGGAVHLALESIYQDWKDRGTPGYTTEMVEKAYELFLEEYRQYFPPDTDEDFGGKNPENTLRALGEYCIRYRDDRFTVHWTEITGTALVGTYNGKELHITFRLDTLCENEHGEFFLLEHKTSSWDIERWSRSHAFAIQAGTGNHALRCLYGDKSRGMVYNGLFLRKVRFTKAGLPYKGDIGNEFIRHANKMNNDQLTDWLDRVNYYMQLIEEEWKMLDQATPDDQSLRAFPKNESSCFEFNRICPFHDFCTAWTNPLKRCEKPPIGFEVRHWNPTELDKNIKDRKEVKL